MAAPVAAPRNDVGCATWVVGTVILIGLLALIWLGFRLTPRLTDLGRVEAPQSTEPAGAEVPAEDPTAAPAAGPPPTAEATEPAPAPAMIPAPDLIGMTLAEAKDALASHGLVLAQSDPVFSEAVPVDAVAEQDPPPNAGMSQGGTVYVKLSRGSAHVDLGSLGLVGGDPSAAEAALRKLGLAVQQTEVPDPGVPAGRVAGFDPATAEVGDTVTLQVSAGNLVRIPGQIQGEPVDQVARQLGDLGLSVGERLPVDRKTIEDAGIDLAQAEIEDGDVVGVQGPKVDFDALVPPGTVVDLVYYDHSLDRQS